MIEDDEADLQKFEKLKGMALSVQADKDVARSLQSVLADGSVAAEPAALPAPERGAPAVPPTPEPARPEASAPGQKPGEEPKAYQLRALT